MNLYLKNEEGKHAFVYVVNGQMARLKFNLDLKDLDDEIYDIVVPKNTWTMTESFFSGLFSESIEYLGLEKFKQKYVFKYADKNQKLVEILEKTAIENLKSVVKYKEIYLK